MNRTRRRNKDARYDQHNHQLLFIFTLMLQFETENINREHIGDDAAQVTLKLPLYFICEGPVCYPTTRRPSDQTPTSIGPFHSTSLLLEALILNKNSYFYVTQ